MAAECQRRPLSEEEGEDAAEAWLRANAFGLEGVKVRGATKIVGFEVGPEAAAVAWRAAVAKWRARVEAVSSIGMPLSLASHFHATHALGVMGFVAQFGPPPLELRAQEERLLAPLFRVPYRAIPWVAMFTKWSADPAFAARRRLFAPHAGLDNWRPALRTL